MSDDGTINGVENPDRLSLVIIDRIKNNILPATMGLFSVEVKQDDGIPYIRITVAQGLEKPYYLRKYGMSVKGCYIRIGSQSSPMTHKLITELSSHRVAHTLTNVVSPNQHLTFTRLKIYYAEKGFEASSEFFLRNLGLFTGSTHFPVGLVSRPRSPACFHDLEKEVLGIMEAIGFTPDGLDQIVRSLQLA